jgi:hypothetical protein
MALRSVQDLEMAREVIELESLVVRGKGVIVGPEEAMNRKREITTLCKLSR